MRWTHFHEHTKKMDRQLTIMSQVLRRALGEIQPTIPEPSEEVVFVDISRFVNLLVVMAPVTTMIRGFAQGWPKGVPLEDVECRRARKKEERRSGSEIDVRP